MAIQVRPKPTRTKPARPRTRHQKGTWDRFTDGLNKLMAAITLLNLGIVAFDYSYIPFRDFYLQHIPGFTRWYGQTFKGIEPHRSTEAYLDTVDQLYGVLQTEGVSQTPVASEDDLNSAAITPSSEAQVDQILSAIEPTTGIPQGADEPAQSTVSAAQLLRQLQVQSVAIIDENPFEVANKSGTLEQIKNEMREHISQQLGREIGSSKEAFVIFWSPDYLTQQGWVQELNFFNSEIRPLINRNYFRGLSESGQPLDLFWTLDQWFIALFAIDFLLRTLVLSRRYRGTSWFDTMLWRWYDIFLLLPFWRWLRVIPVIVRINQSNLIDLEPVSNRIRRFIVTHFAIELTETVVIRLIEQAQNLLRSGEVTQALLQPKQYIDLNDVNEVETITHRLISILIYQVLPEVQPEVEAILDHSVHNAFNSSPLYSSIHNIPGLSNLPDRLTHQISRQVFENVYGVLSASLKDEKAAELNQRLVARLGEIFRNKLQEGDTVEELEALLTVLLEEIKINYVQRLAAEDVEALREQTHRIYEISQG